MNDHDDHDPLTPEDAQSPADGSMPEASPQDEPAPAANTLDAAGDETSDAMTDAPAEGAADASVPRDADVPESTTVSISEGAVEPVAAQDDADLAGADERSKVSGQWVEYAPIDPDQANIDAALAAVASLGALSELEREEDRDDRPFMPPTPDYAGDAISDDVPAESAAPVAADDYLSDDLAERESLYRSGSRSVSRSASRRAAHPPLSRAAASTLTTSMFVPPMSGLKRGSPGSLIPALALIGVGAWLTFATTTGSTVAPLLLIGIGVGVAVLSLFAYWISTGRWSRGVLFTAALIALLAGIVVASLPIPGLNLSSRLDLTQAYPLVLSAVGIAMLIGGLLARPRSRATFAPGLVLLAAGVVGTLVTLGFIPSSILDLAVRLWFVPVVVLVIVWLLPLVFRLRDRD